jgi:hypothetical protein
MKQIAGTATRQPKAWVTLTGKYLPDYMAMHIRNPSVYKDFKIRIENSGVYFNQCEEVKYEKGVSPTKRASESITNHHQHHSLYVVQLG